MADGMTTDIVSCRGDAPRICGGSADHVLVGITHALEGVAEITTKNTITTASATFDAMPRPSAITKIEPSTTRGIELAIWM